MTTFNTGNPIGSTDARDRSDNSENLDLAVNSLEQTFVDRLGVTRDTLEGIYQKSAYYRAGTFDTGYTLTNNRQTLAYGNVEYSWSGAFPKVVPAGSTPASTGGIGTGAWVDRTQETLSVNLKKKVSYASLFSPVPSDAASLQNFLLSDSDKFVIDIPISVTKLGLESLPLYGLQVPAGKSVEWVTGKFTTLEPGVDVRHIFTGQGAANSNVTYINPQIDGNGSSANGIGGNNATSSQLENVWVLGGVIKGIKRAKYRGSFGGGSCVTFQYGVRNCGAINVKAIDSFMPANAAGRETETSYGDQSAYNIIFDGFYCENCETLGGAINLLTNSTVPTSAAAQAVFSNFTFRNCGRSDTTGSFQGLSFVRRNSAGNSSPIEDVYIDSTSYSGYWTLDTFNISDTEWDESAASYAIGARVKVTNDGTLSSLFFIEGNSGAHIDGVSGFNDADYGQIGSIISGAGSGVQVDNVFVNVNTKELIHCGGMANIWPVITRPANKVADSQFDITNIGTTGYIVGATIPVITDTTPYQQSGLLVKATVRRANNTGIIDSQLGGALNGHQTYIEAHDCHSMAVKRGSFDHVYNSGNLIPTAYGSYGLNDVDCLAKLIQVYQSNTQLRLQRLGSGAGYVDLYANGNTFHIGNTIYLQLDATGGGLKLADSAAVLHTFGANTAGQLTADTFPIGRRVSVPASSTASGTSGDWAADSTGFYYCYATNSWRKTAGVVF